MKWLKIFNTNHFNNELISQEINKTEGEMKVMISSISRMDEIEHKPKKKRKKIVKQDIMLNKNSIKLMIVNMKKTFIRTRML